MKPAHFSYNSMGTTWKITIWDPISQDTVSFLEETIKKQSHDFDKTYSRFIKDSLVWKISKKPGRYAVPKDFIEMLTWYKKLYEATDKKLNPLIGNTISDLGYDADYSLIPKTTIRKTPDLGTIRIVDDTHIETDESALFDFGALGKGYFVDVIAQFLKSKGLQHFLVDGSGDIYYEGKGNPLRIGLEHPHDATKVIGVISLTKGGVCGSGTNRRKWGNYHHVIDPTTNDSTEGIIATWVMGESAVLADALASCLFFVVPEKLASLFTFEYCIVYESNKIKDQRSFISRSLRETENKDLHTANSMLEIKRSAGFNAELF